VTCQSGPAAIPALISTSVASMSSAEKRAASGWLTPEVVKLPIFTRIGGCAADSAAMSAILRVRLFRSNDILPWLTLPPAARICSNAASTWLTTRCSA